MNVNIIDSGYGNIGSVINMLKKVDVAARVCTDSKLIKNASHIILPGVGSFDAGIKGLYERGFYDVIQNEIKTYQIPVLGICLGMQLLFNGSEEGFTSGLGIFDNKLEKIDPTNSDQTLKVPHMGWNFVNFSENSKLGNGFQEDARFYFVHSYFCKNTKYSYCKGFTNYGNDFTSVVEKDNFFGVQFHPEKSLNFGIKLFKNFLQC